MTQLSREDWIKAGLHQLADAGIHKVRIETLACLLKMIHSFLARSVY